MVRREGSGTYFNSGELDFHKIVGVYFPEPIKASEIGVLYTKDGEEVANTAILQKSEFAENYGKIPLGVREGIKNYALRKIYCLNEETTNRRRDLISELGGLTLDKVRKRIAVLDPIIDTAIELEDYGMPEVGGFEGDIMELAVACIGEETINKSIDNYWLNIQQATKFGEKCKYLEQQTEELDKLHWFYQRTLQ
ncbi:MAG: hypothetical protein KAT28_02970 [Candidatus Aenigmarchaeota archaeon]|nr:hypothetical protein [Candidatus Aenigmarchaeota archaeon]